MRNQRVLVVALSSALALPGAAARAQRAMPGFFAAPAVWVSGSVGYYNPGPVNDGATSATWHFGVAAQLRAALQVPLWSDTYTAGIAATWSRMPLRYYSANPLIDPTGNGITAHADIWSALGVFRRGGTRGFHQILEIAAGVIGYRHFRTTNGRRHLSPQRSDIDFTIGASYGFGYSLSPRSEITLVQEYAYAFHQRDALPSSISAASTQTNLRLGLRFGLGTHLRGF
jgi:hypothetical protein